MMHSSFPRAASSWITTPPTRAAGVGAVINLVDDMRLPIRAVGVIMVLLTALVMPAGGCAAAEWNFPHRFRVQIRERHYILSAGRDS